MCAITGCFCGAWRLFFCRIDAGIEADWSVGWIWGAVVSWWQMSLMFLYFVWISLSINKRIPLQLGFTVKHSALARGNCVLVLFWGRHFWFRCQLFIVHLLLFHAVQTHSSNSNLFLTGINVIVPKRKLYMVTWQRKLGCRIHWWYWKYQLPSNAALVGKAGRQCPGGGMLVPSGVKEASSELSCLWVLNRLQLSVWKASIQQQMRTVPAWVAGSYLLQC